jgi:hypothetical protein
MKNNDIKQKLYLEKIEKILKHTLKKLTFIMKIRLRIIFGCNQVECFINSFLRKLQILLKIFRFY